MSWIVEHLLRNSETIRSNVLSESQSYLEVYDGAYKDTLESDEYNDLLVVEKKVDELYLIGILSDMDLIVLNMFKSDVILADESKTRGEKRTLAKTFSQICERIAYFLGGYFTDDGFIENLKLEYGLSEEEFYVVKEYMSGRYEPKLIRRNKTE